MPTDRPTESGAPAPAAHVDQLGQTPALLLPYVAQPGRAPALFAEVIEEPQLVLGAFQRAHSALALEACGELLLTRRSSGGPALFASPGSLHLALALPSPTALVPDADVPRLVNRHVRPLLKALTRLGAQAHYFGRDFVSVAHKPATWVGFAHHAASGACLFEALVALEHPFALPEELDGYPARAIPPYLGKQPSSVVQASGKQITPSQLRDAVVMAYQQAYGPLLIEQYAGDSRLRTPIADRESRWDSLTEHPIGFLGTQHHPRSLGGDLLASCDLVAAINTALCELPAGSSPERIEEAIAQASDQVTDGVIEGVTGSGGLRSR